VSRKRQLLAVAAIVTLVLGAVGRAQDKAPPGLVPVKLQVVISRYQGEKRVSNLPYMLAVDAGGGKASLRSGLEMAVSVKVDDKASPIQYKPFGTNIDATLTRLDDGRFRLLLNVEDSSVYGDDPASLASAKSATMFRSFKWGGELLLSDGQSSQFMTATDKFNGEVTKVDVTLNVVK